MAIAAVLLVHSNFGFHSAVLEGLRSRGWIGVDLFFVISGYLITSILLSTREHPHYYRNFYARRGLRIWPLYYLLLLFIFGLSRHLGIWAHQDPDPRLFHWQYYLFYVQNLVYDRLGSFALVITWSLCVEEQFYLIWPFVVRLCSRRSLTAVAVAVLLLGTPFRMYLHHIGAARGFFFTFTRLDPIAVGALIALQPRWFKYAWVATPAAVWLLYRNEFEFVYLALALTFGSAVMHVVTTGCGWLRVAPLRFMGKISYGLYILHPIAFAIFWRTPLYWGVGHWPMANLIRMLGEVLFPLPFAVCSWYLFEKPLLGLKKYFAADRNQPRLASVRAFATGAGD